MTSHALPHLPSFSLLRLNIMGWVIALWSKLALWRERSQSRNRLASMDGAALKDIGLSRCDAWQEVNKPFWEE
jgi:uncharacterized protein YjiS (DUF1127 family)